jgi:thioredoxin 1
MVEHLSDNDFQEKINNSKIPVIVDFWAPWCGPCRMMAPVFESLSKEFEGKVLFAKLNVEENEKYASIHGVEGIPSLIVFNKGKEIGRIVGYNTENILREKIKEIVGN